MFGMHALLALSPWLVVSLVALLPALEASTLLGLVIPGETALLAGGVAAHAGAVPLWAVVVAGCCGAAVGDQVGYAFGRRYGPRLLCHLPRRLRGSGGVERTLDLVRRRGALAIVLGRWVAAMRALVPGIAGMSGVGRLRFTVANLIGGTLWAVAVTVAGYFVGASYAVLERRLGFGSEVLLAALVALLAVWAVRARRARAQKNADA